MRVVRLLSGIALICAVSALALSLQRASAHPPAIVSEAQRKLISEEVAAFRRDVAAAIKAKDAKRLQRMYAPSFVHTHTSGKVDGKDARIATLLKGDPVIETAPVSDLVIRIPNDWVGIATGVSPIKSDDGKTYDVRWTAVYTREGQSWNVAASHATRLGETKR
ncbi:nuclear transport factor 2 family protein [Hyphomicrobium sp. CS1BSMeth3]|uniref:nuclear transport factor 2 family protein n=1 Tax=Hyphomicrobium sp. CS1BSMeth3 TaxID=1892844 RepID=UPI0009314BF3|nr:nuclear transport factor 2 family protein [Hyphomicrobium sp. CS1BSMeth3]